MVADSSPTAAELVAMTVTTLKEMCKEKGLKVSGRKQELVDRLLEATASDDDLLILEEDDESPELALEEEVLEAEVLDSEVEDETFIIPEDEPYEAEILDAEIFEAELFEDEEDEILEPIQTQRTVRLEKTNLLATLAKPGVLATLLVVLIITGGGYWYWTSNLSPFVATPIEYGDRMEFTISSGSFDVEGESMIRELDDNLNGALSEVCEEFHVEFAGTGDIDVKRGDSSELLDSSDSKLTGAVQARDAYGLTFLAVEQELTHDLTASISSKTWLGDSSEGMCSVPVGPISGYALSQNSKSWTEIQSKALLSTHSSISLDNQGDETRVEAVSFGVPEDSLSNLMPELLLPLKPVETTSLFGNSLLEEGKTGTSGNWQWIVGSAISVGGEKGLQVNMQHTEVEDCIGRVHMVLYIVPSSPWAVQQQVDIKLEKSRYDSSECGMLADYVLDRALPEGSISIQYTMTRTSSTEGDGMIDWQSGYGNRPGSNSGALSPSENWGNSGHHMPDESTVRSWPLEEAVSCIVNSTLEAEEAATALASGGYVFKAVDNRNHGNTEWNVSWVNDDDAGWVIVEQRPENCSILDKANFDEADKPAHRRESIPKSATIKQVESRLLDPERYPGLTSNIAPNGELSNDAPIGYFLTVPPEAGDIFDLLEGYQDGTVVVFGERDWTENGLDHSLNYAIDGTTGRMGGWVKTSTNS